MNKTASVYKMMQLGMCAAMIAGSAWLIGCQPERESLRHRQAARTAIFQHNYAVAAEQYEMAAQADQTDAAAWYGLGLMRLKLDQPLAAQVALERALALRPRDPQWTPSILDNLAEAIYLQDDPDALHDFLTWMVNNYKSSDDFLRQGIYLARIGDMDNARVAMEKGLRFAKPDSPQPYIVLADFYGILNDPTRAVQSLRYAYYLDPNNEETEAKFRQYGIVPGPTQRQVPPPRPTLSID